MTIKETLEADLKSALLAGNKTLVTTLRGLKSAILYEEVAKGSRDTGGISDDEVIQLFAKEAKKRQESAELFMQGGNNIKADAELQEKLVIERYLPKQLGDDELSQIVSEIIGNNSVTKAEMGKYIGLVRAKVGALADGGRIAAAVKQRISD